MKKTLSIEGMTCSGCVRHTTEALKELDGVTSVTVDLGSKSAVVDSSAEISDDALKAAISEAGYTVTAIN